MKTQTSQQWYKVRFGDLIESKINVEIKKGKSYESLPMELISSSYKFPEAYIVKEFKGSGSRFENGDTVFARITPCLQNGKIAQIKNLKMGAGFGSTEFFVFRAKKSVADPDYIFYVAKTKDIRELAEKSMSGASGRQRADKSVIENIVINVPALSTQKQIADVLSAYDDLIENNNRRIKILEDIAQKIYTEWFVKFHFPGWENVKMVESGTEFGKIPEGWEIKTLGAMVHNFDSRRQPLAKMKRAQIQGHIPYYGAAKIIDSVNKELFDGKFLLFAEDGSVITKEGKPILQFVNEKFWVSNHAHVLQGKDVSTEYLFLALSRVQIQGYITGAAQPKITQENMNRILLVFPDRFINKAFDEYIVSMFQIRSLLEKTVKKLHATRDKLLPKIVTGKWELK